MTKEEFEKRKPKVLAYKQVEMSPYYMVFIDSYYCLHCANEEINLTDGAEGIYSVEETINRSCSYCGELISEQF